MKLKLLFSCLALLLMVGISEAKPKRKPFNNSSEEVFLAALRTARERHVVTYVNEKQMLISFETGQSLTSKGFVANASVEPDGANKATLIINVQNKNGLSWGAGDRMADKFFGQVEETLAGEVKQKTVKHSEAKAIDVPEPKANPVEPTIAKPAAAAAAADVGLVNVKAEPEGADIYADGDFVGNAPATLRLKSGAHEIRVSQKGYAEWSRKMTVHAGSEVSLRAQLEKQTAAAK